MTSVPPFLGEFSNEDAAWFINVGDRRRIPAGEAIILEGEPVTELFVILKGSFSVASRRVPGMPYTRLVAGEIAGEMTFMSRELPLSSVRAEVDSMVLCIPRTALHEKLAVDEGFKARFHKVVAEFVEHRLRRSWLPPPPEPPQEPPEPPQPPKEPPDKPRKPRKTKPPKPNPPDSSATEESPEKRMWRIIKDMLDEDRP